MNVWIENPFDNLPVEGYRPQRYWLMAEEFVSQGHDVVYWTSDFSHSSKSPRTVQGELFPPRFSLEFVKTKPYRANVGFERVASHRDYALQWLSDARKKVAAEGRAPDVVIASLPTLSAAGAAVRMKREFGAFLVIDIMDAWPDTFKRLLPRPLKWLSGVLFAPLNGKFAAVCSSADLVTGVCERYRRLALDAGAGNYSRAYHGIRLQEKPEKKSSPAAFHLVYAGASGRTYDLETPVRALARMSACTLTVASSGPRMDRLRRLARSLGCEERLFTPGYLDAKELSGLLASADAGIVPMDVESCVGMPYKIADYAAAGVPVVSSLQGESLELLSRYNAGAFYAPGDVDAFIAAVETVAADTDVFSAGAWKLARAEFNADMIYPSYVKHVAEAYENAKGRFVAGENH